MLSALALVPLWTWAQTPMRADSTLSEAHVEGMHAGKTLTSATPLQHLDSRQMKQIGATTMADAVRSFAGVNLRDYGGAGGMKTVNVRGLGASHTAVSYDGIVVGNAQGGQIDLSRFLLSRLSHLSLQTAESDALLTTVREQGNATLLLQTDFAATRTIGLTGTLGLETGSFGLFHPSVSLTGQTSEAHAIGMMADFHYGKNDYPFLFRNGVATHKERRLNSRLRDTTVELNDRIDLGDHGTIASKAYFSNRNRQLPGPTIFYVQGNHERLHERQAFMQSRWTMQRTKWQAFAAAKVSWEESKYADEGGQYPGGALHQNYRQREAYGSGGVGRSWTHWQVALAADYAYADLASNLTTDSDVARHSLLSSVAVRWMPSRFTLTLRLVDAALWNRSDGPSSARNLHHLSPSASMIWNCLTLPQAHLSVRAHYKDFFRPPTFNESYYYHLGSTSLRPERTRQIGMGGSLLWLPAEKWRLSVDANSYFNRIADKISAIPYNLFVWRMTNLGRVRAAGLDLVVQADWQVRPRHGLMLRGTYTLQSVRNRTQRGDASFGKQLAYVPTHSGTMALSWTNPWVNATLSLQACSMRWATNEHTESTETPGYGEWSLGLWRNITVGRHRITVGAHLLNILDRQYSIIRRYPMPGRAWKVSADWHF